MFNKRTLCVEESVHVLFDKTNALVENDAQDEEYELGLARRDLLHTQNYMHEKGKSPEGEPGPGANILEGGQGLNQTGGSIAERSLSKTNLILPEQAPKQAPEQAPEQFLNLFHRIFQQE